MAVIVSSEILGEADAAASALGVHLQRLGDETLGFSVQRQARGLFLGSVWRASAEGRPCWVSYDSANGGEVIGRFRALAGAVKRVVEVHDARLVLTRVRQEVRLKAVIEP